MKIIHTADWHLGQQFYKYSRDEDHRHALRQFISIARRERPDAIMICGDIFDTAMPGVLSQQLYVETMRDLHEHLPDTTLITITGNHDSPTRLEVYSPVWKGFNHYVVGTCSSDNPEKHVIPVRSVDNPGIVAGYVIAVPFVHPFNVPQVGDGYTASAKRLGMFYRHLESYLAGICAESLPIVVMGHMAIESCDMTGHDRSLIGNLEYSDVDSLGDRFDYAALGHIHRPQTIAKSAGKIRYSGSLIPVNFNEDYPHTISIVEIESHGSSPSVREEPIEVYRKLITVGGDSGADESEIEGLLSELVSSYRSDRGAFVRINLHSPEGFVTPSVISRCGKILENSPLTICHINAVRNTDESDSRGECRAEAGTAVERLDPLSVARMYYARSNNNVSLPDEFEQMLNETIEELSAEIHVKS